MKLDGKYGAIDRAANEVVPIVFDRVLTDSIGRPYAVSLHERIAVIDSTLNVDFSQIYEEISGYGELGERGLALVKIDGLSGLIDKNMREVIPPEYNEIHPFAEGLSRIVKDGKYNYINASGKRISRTDYDNGEDFIGDYALVTKGDTRGALDRFGVYQPLIFDHGLATLRREGKLAIINEKGQLVNDLLYEEVAPFDNDRARIRRTGYGFIDTAGNEVVKPVYQEVMPFEGNVARVKISDSWGTVDKDGNVLAHTVYTNIEPFIDGLARVKRSRQYGFLSTDGQEAIHAAYDSISNFEESGLARTFKNGKYGLVNKTGKEISIAQYDYMSPFSDGMYAVRLGDKAGYIDSQGKIAIKFKYDEALGFVNGLAPVRKKDKWGVIDITGRTVIPIKYDPIKDLSGDIITVTKKEEVTNYDRLGKKIK